LLAFCLLIFLLSLAASRRWPGFTEVLVVRSRGDGQQDMDYSGWWR
jgi:hypothetical protein